MSGHSHFRTIKHKKELEDQKRGQIFSKLSRLISIAAAKGADPDKNSALKQALEEAKKFNMPKENIERAIKRGTGQLKDEAELFEVTYETIGPKGEMAILEGITDNKNRALAEVKNILQRNGWKLADQGTLKWMFQKMGSITIDGSNFLQTGKSKEEIELLAIEAGAEDLTWQNNELDIFFAPEKLGEVKENLLKYGFTILEENIILVPNNPLEIPENEKEKYQKLFEQLLDTETIQNIYSNLNI
ncbi:MAG: YebC/PmpR family DNA-binding transcriptional regulator [Minisyncoccia bacterium]